MERLRCPRLQLFQNDISSETTGLIESKLHVELYGIGEYYFVHILGHMTKMATELTVPKLL